LASKASNEIILPPPAIARPGASLKNQMEGAEGPVFNAAGMAPTDQSRLEAAGLPYRGPAAPTPRPQGSGTGAPPWMLARSLGQTPTLPPFPVSGNPSAPAPVPAPIMPGGRMGPPQSHMIPAVVLKRAQADRFLKLAEDSMVEIRGVTVKPAMFQRDRDRMAARSIGQCMKSLSRSLVGVGRAMKELRLARDENRDAALSDEELGALELFATCAEKATEERDIQRKQDAAVGGGVPALLSLALLVL
jgi:hypothetical protein